MFDLVITLVQMLVIILVLSLITMGIIHVTCLVADRFTHWSVGVAFRTAARASIAVPVGMIAFMEQGSPLLILDETCKLALFWAFVVCFMVNVSVTAAYKTTYTLRD